MKYKQKIIRPYFPWFLLLFGMDAFFILLLWIADVKALKSMILLLGLSSTLLYILLIYVLTLKEEKKKQAFLDFLENPDNYQENLLLEMLDQTQKEAIQLLAEKLRKQQADYMELQEQWNGYEEYVETWTHEAKTPLSLLTLLLDNRKEELSPDISFKLDYIRNHIQEAIDQMLFYARLNGNKKDYLFESLDIHSCIEEVLEDYLPLLKEKQFEIDFSLSIDTVYSDRRGLHFLLGQIISNSLKYYREKPKLSFSSFRKENYNIISIKDNGIGVKPSDLPYIFGKGFTGNSGEGRKKATGIGLYLVKEIAQELNIALEVSSTWNKGFEIQILFPIVEDTSPSML